MLRKTILMRTAGKLPDDISELKRLRVDEGLRVAEIAKRFGVTTQAVYDRFAKAGITAKELKPKYHRPHELSDAVRELLTVQRLCKEAAARELGVPPWTIAKIAKQLQISRMKSCKKYPVLNTIKVGESVLLPRGKTRDQQCVQFYRIAKQLGIKLSVRKIDDETVRVTREPTDFPRSEIAELRRLYLKEGLSVQELAERFGVSLRAMHGRLNRAGIERRERTRRFPLPDPEAVRTMVKEGLPIKEIAQRLNISVSTVKTVLKQPDKIDGRLNRYQRYGVLNFLKVGESAVLFRGETFHERYTAFYNASRRRGIKLSLRRISKQRIRITRVE